MDNVDFKYKSKDDENEKEKSEKSKDLLQKGETYIDNSWMNERLKYEAASDV